MVNIDMNKYLFRINEEIYVITFKFLSFIDQQHFPRKMYYKINS